MHEHQPKTDIGSEFADVLAMLADDRDDAAPVVGRLPPEIVWGSEPMTAREYRIRSLGELIDMLEDEAEETFMRDTQKAIDICHVYGIRPDTSGPELAFPPLLWEFLVATT